MTAVEPGLHFKIPTNFIQSVDYYDVRTQKYVANASAASHDLQDVSTEVTVNYRLDPVRVPYIYLSTGHDFQSKVITPAVQEVVKASTAKYNATALIQNRETVKSSIDRGLRERLAPYDIIIDPMGVSITNFEFSKGFQQAVEDKNTAIQLRDKSKNDLERVQYETQQNKTKAEADKIYATPEMIELRKLEMQKLAIQAWNGVLPQYIGGSAPLPFINVGSV